MQAKVKATGEIVDVCFSPTNCMEAGGKRWWKTSELEFSPIKPETINPLPPMEMSYNPQSMMARLAKDLHIHRIKDAVEAALKIATKPQLRVEINIRVEACKTLKDKIMRCLNCKHCIKGYTTRQAASRKYKTFVCEMRTNDKEWRGCFYSILHSCKDCEDFEPKELSRE